MSRVAIHLVGKCGKLLHKREIKELNEKIIELGFGLS